MTTIPHNALIVIADGGGARLFRNSGSGATVTLKAERDLSPKDLQGPSGSRPEDQTKSQTAEATFAKQLAQTLEGMSGKNAFSDLVIVADPQTLGQIRDAMHKTVEAKVVLSLSKDLTNHSPDDIAKALS